MTYFQRFPTTRWPHIWLLLHLQPWQIKKPHEHKSGPYVWPQVSDECQFLPAPHSSKLSRMLIYVNASDYLPTTEASGVRLTIHDKGYINTKFTLWCTVYITDQYPFPDTFGYSAPTGFISSFGLKLVSLLLCSTAISILDLCIAI